MPEPQGRSFAELDLLFERGVSARNFAGTKVDVFGEAVDVDARILGRYEEKFDDEARHEEAERAGVDVGGVREKSG